MKKKMVMMVDSDTIPLDEMKILPEADELKQFAATAGIPIEAMTRHCTEPRHKNIMMSLGISDCIIKLFDPREMISKIRQFMPDNDGETIPGKDVKYLSRKRG